MYDFIMSLNTITTSLLLASFFIVLTNLKLTNNSKTIITRCLLIVTIFIMKICFTLQKPDISIFRNSNYESFYMILVGDAIIFLFIHLLFGEEKISFRTRNLLVIEYLFCIISFYFSVNGTNTDINNILITSIIIFNIYYFFNKYLKAVQGMFIFYIMNFIYILESNILNILIYSNIILDLILSIIILMKIFSIYIEVPNNKYLKIRSTLSRSNINIKIYDEKLNNLRIFNQMLREDFQLKEKNLEILLGQFKQSALLIDNDNYIINNDIVLKTMFPRYSNYDKCIALGEFLNDNIAESNQFLQSIEEARYYSKSITTEITGKDGRIFECIFSLYEEYESSNVICILWDVTSERKINLKIQESDIKYKKIVKNIPYSIILEKNKDIIYNNNLDIDLDNENVKNIILSDATKGEINYIDEEGKEISLYVDRIKFKEGEETLSLIEIKNNSKYKTLLKKLEASTNQYKTLIDTIPEAICVLDYESKDFEYANDTFYNLFKIQDIENMDLDEIYNDIAISSGNINESIKYIRKTLKDGFGGIINIESCVVLININNSTKMVLIIRDVTGEIKVESMKKEIEESELINKDIDEFFINMSHELLTPANLLNTSNQFIVRNCKDIIDRDPNGEFARCIDIITKHVDILTILIEKIMELSKLESNYHKDVKDIYDIVSICVDIVTELNKYTDYKGVNIIFDTDEEEVYTEIDPDNIAKAILTFLALVIKNSRIKSTINFNIKTKNNKAYIIIENFKRYSYEKHFNNYEEKILNLSLSIAKLIINLYKGKVDIKLNNEDCISIEIELNMEMNINECKIVNKTIDQNLIYDEYRILCDF